MVVKISWLASKSALMDYFFSRPPARASELLLRADSIDLAHCAVQEADPQPTVR